MYSPIREVLKTLDKNKPQSLSRPRLLIDISISCPELLSIKKEMIFIGVSSRPFLIEKAELILERTIDEL